MNIKHDVSPGTVFGRLTVIGKAPAPKGQSRVYCSCSCGAQVELPRGSLTQGSTRSCGCLRREVSAERSTSHGMARSREHRSWMSARERCTNQRNKAYADYGGRGITMCAGWESFAAFLADMGPCPPGMTIDRIDNDGGYWCGRCDQCVRLELSANCRWATRQQQNNNRRLAVLVTVRGETLNVTEWARRSGLSHHTIARRIARGWTPEQAVTKYPGRPHQPPVSR